MEGPGVSGALTPVIAPGGSSSELSVTLHSGSYEPWYPVGDHKGLGMNVTTTVRRRPRDPSVRRSHSSATRAASLRELRKRD